MGTNPYYYHAGKGTMYIFWQSRSFTKSGVEFTFVRTINLLLYIFTCVKYYMQFIVPL